MSNITNILNIIKMTPKDHIYWCTLCGPCKVEINELEGHPITVIGTVVERTIKLTAFGEYVPGYPTGDCVLFPSKENRIWEEFNIEETKKETVAMPKKSNFDIAKAKDGFSVQTKEGNEVRIICYDKKGGNYPIIALVKDKRTETERFYEYNADGECGTTGFDEHKLVMAPTHCEGWTVVRQDNSENISLGNLYPTQEEAMNEILSMRKQYKLIKVVKIEFDV